MQWYLSHVEGLVPGVLLQNKELVPDPAASGPGQAPAVPPVPGGPSPRGTPGRGQRDRVQGQLPTAWGPQGEQDGAHAEPTQNHTARHLQRGRERERERETETESEMNTGRPGDKGVPQSDRKKLNLEV